MWPTSGLSIQLLSAIEREVLHPQVIEIAVQKAVTRLQPSVAELRIERAHLEAQMIGLDRELEQLTAAIAAGGELATLTAGLREREAAKAALARRIAVLDAQASLGAMDPARLTNDLRARVDDWRGLLRRHVPKRGRFSKGCFLSRSSSVLRLRALPCTATRALKGASEGRQVQIRWRP